MSQIIELTNYYVLTSEIDFIDIVASSSEFSPISKGKLESVYLVYRLEPTPSMLQAPSCTHHGHGAMLSALSPFTFFPLRLPLN